MRRAVMLACLALATSAGAQAPRPAAVPCSYEQCALGIAPVWNGLAVALAAAGTTAFALSVPLQFSADGWLSRAVWWSNAGFSP